MYTIYADGQLLYSSASEDEKTIALSPKLSLDVSKAGSLSFVLPPGNQMHGSIKKLKGTITVKQDEEEIFRGRVLEDEKDFFNQKNVYCEGARAYLNDSIQRAYTYSGTVQGLFRKLISNHNSQVDSEKQFTIGTITAVDSSTTVEIENESYTDTASEIEEKLLNAYGGYLKTRTDGNKQYIDWVKKYSGTNSQKIEFAVNLLDIKDKVSAGDVFTVLIPLGASSIGDDGNYTEPLNVSSVNNGLDYIQDDAAVALYGKIWRTRTWTYEEDASALLKKGREYLKTGVEVQTLTLKAIDMHFVNGNAQSIRIGDDVHILSNPHGLDKTMICSKIEIDLFNPENTVYTFGEPPRTLTENIIRAEKDLGDLTGGSYGRGGGGGRKSVQEELSDIIRWAKINVDEANANINLNAGEINKHENRLSQAEIDIDGINAEIILKASRTEVDAVGRRVDEAEASIKVNADEIELKVSKNGVISAINQTAESITISASKVNLNGYVTASQLSAEIADLNLAMSNTVSTGTLRANSGIIEYLTLGGDYISKDEATFVTSASLSISKSYAVEAKNGETVYVYHYKLSAPTDTIEYLDW